MAQADAGIDDRLARLNARSRLQYRFFSFASSRSGGSLTSIASDDLNREGVRAARAPLFKEQGQVVHADASVVIEIRGTGCPKLVDTYLPELLVQKDHVTFIDSLVAVEVSWCTGRAKVSDTYDIAKSS